MSNDPSDYGGDVPPPGPLDPYGYSPDVPRISADVRLVQARVQGPAIGLIIVGVINLLLALLAGFLGFQIAASPVDMNQLEKQVEMQQPENVRQMRQMGLSVRDIINAELYGGCSEGVLGVVTAILAIIAGVRMLALKSYGFAFFSSVLVAIPCISCSGCCGLGEGIGIWALVVLMNEEVKAAFR
jgi:hypothetical protein